MAKRLTQLLEQYDLSKVYSPSEAVELVKKLATAKFDETVEAHYKLGINPKYPEQNVRFTVILPHGTGKTVRVLVLAKGEKVTEATNAGADYVGADDMVQRIQDGWLDFDVVIATPDMMGTVGRLGKILGPRGLMPNPKTGTVTMDIERTVKEFKAGKVEVRNDKTGNVHVPIGKASFDAQMLLDNFYAVTAAIVHAKPATSKGTYVKAVSMCSTMGPSVKMDPRQTVEESLKKQA
ncbi:50S ribosomal protein L1 [Coprothermobacter platensis]|jgi:large subunit ribosomal protein L1|uniref:50S ribosomal protein L1 n=1 Tax=Coprothermobacter platensis TaxID=108819 RepID=UPI0003651D16|nr:50S ribosomal protein L1 [Coprothermobacter platensis]